MNKKLTYLIAAILMLVCSGRAWSQEFDSADGMLHYNVYDAENFPLNVEVGKTDATAGNITIPAQVTHNGVTYKVVRTCDWAFNWCEALTGITLSEGIEQINGASFEGCTNLASVSLPSTLTTIGGYGFANCSSLKNLVIPGSVVEFSGDTWATFLGVEFNSITFESCAVALPSGLDVTAKNVVLNRNGGRFHGVESVVIGGSATEISNHAFNSCDMLTSFELKSTITCIGKYALWGCSSLKEFTIPSTVTTFGEEAFGYCEFDKLVIEDNPNPLNLGYFSFNAHNAYIGRALTSERGEIFYNNYFDGTLEIGGGVKTLTTQYAKNLEEMKKLVLGSGVQKIEDEALRECRKLADMYVSWKTPLAINENVFLSWEDKPVMPEGATLWVPAGTKAAYQKATGWNLFKNIRPTHYIVTLKTVGTGKVTLDGKTSGEVLVAYNASNIEFTLAAGENYDFAKLNNGTADVYTNASQGATKQGGTYVLPSINGDMTFTATFTEKPKFAITATATGGTATASAAQVYRDRDAYVTFAANEGYELTSVKLNNVEVLSQVQGNKLNITNVQAAQNVVATFTRIHYSISAATTTNGTITLATADAQWGDNTTVTITPAEGYMINTVTVNDVDATSQLSGNTLTISNVRKNITIAATFKLLEYTVSISGVGVTADKMNPKHGESVTITVAEDPDRALTSLLVNGEEQKDNMVGNAYTVSNVSGDITVAATFISTKEFITISEQGFATYACSQDLDFSGSALKAYVAVGYDKNTGSVILSQVTDVPAGTGIYLKAAKGTYKIPYSTSNSYYSNMLAGNTVAEMALPQTSGDKTNFYLDIDEKGAAKFVLADGVVKVGKNSACLQIPTAERNGKSEITTKIFNYVPEGTVNCDVNGDGVVNMQDANIVVNTYLGK